MYLLLKLIYRDVQYIPRPTVNVPEGEATPAPEGMIYNRITSKYMKVDQLAYIVEEQDKTRHQAALMKKQIEEQE